MICVCSEEGSSEAAAASTTSAAAAGGGEGPRELKGVMRVGLLAKGLLLHGDLELQLIVLCHNRPTKALLKSLADKLPAEFEVNLFIIAVVIELIHVSWKVLFFFLENSRTWKVLEKCFWKSCIFHRLKIIFFCLLRSDIICSLLLLNLWCQYVIFKHSWATKRSWKIFHAGPGKFWKSHGYFLSVKEWDYINCANIFEVLELFNVNNVIDTTNRGSVSVE